MVWDLEALFLIVGALAVVYLFSVLYRHLLGMGRGGISPSLAQLGMRLVPLSGIHGFKWGVAAQVVYKSFGVPDEELADGRNYEIAYEYVRPSDYPCSLRLRFLDGGLVGGEYLIMAHDQVEAITIAESISAGITRWIRNSTWILRKILRAPYTEEPKFDSLGGAYWVLEGVTYMVHSHGGDDGEVLFVVTVHNQDPVVEAGYNSEHSVRRDFGCG